MYNISDDPRCQKTCTLIYEALIELLEENNMVLESITISDISKQSSVGRATFYRHFDTTLDVLRWASNSTMEESADVILLSANNYQQFCYNFYSYWTKHSQLLDALMHIGHPSIFLASLEQFFMCHQQEIFGSQVDGQATMQDDYLIGAWAAINWSVLKKWILRGKKETDRELADIALRMLPIPFGSNFQNSQGAETHRL